MRSILLILALLISPRAFASVNVTGTGTGTTSATLSATKPGDLVLVFAYRAGSATAPSLPATLTNVANGSSATGANRSWRVGCRVAKATTDTASGTWTNATNIAIISIAGTAVNDTATCNTVAIGTIGTPNSVSSATATFSSLTVSNANNTVIGLMGSSTSGQTCMPAGMTSQAALGDVNLGIANATGNWSSATCSITSSVTTEIVIEIVAETVLTPCSSGCPTFVQYKAWGGFSGGPPNAADAHLHMPQPVLTNNLLACYLGRDGTAITASVTADGTSMTAGTASNDGTRVINWYYLPAATGKQNIDVALSAAATNVQFGCMEFYNVATSSPVDGTPTSASGITGPFAAPGSITTTQANDLILVVGIDDNSLCCNVAVNNFSAPGTNYTMHNATRRFGPFVYSIAWGGSGAINPGIRAYQSGTADTWGVAAIAFKASPGAGTAPSGMYIAHEIVEVPGATSDTIQLPCSGNLWVALGSTTPTQAKINSITDSDSNTWSWIGTSTSQPQIFHADNAACSNNNTRTATITMSSVATPDPIYFYDVVGAAASPLDTSVTTSTSGASAAAGLVNSGAQNQLHYSVSSTSCPNSANSNSVLNFTPSTNSGIAFVVENNGEGPECGASSTGNVLDSDWFHGENDSCCGTLSSSSGYGHLAYSNAVQQTFTFNWANCLADPTSTTGCSSGTGVGTAPGSSYSMSIAAFKAAATAASNKTSSPVIY